MTKIFPKLFKTWRFANVFFCVRTDANNCCLRGVLLIFVRVNVEKSFPTKTKAVKVWKLLQSATVYVTFFFPQISTECLNMFERCLKAFFNLLVTLFSKRLHQAFSKKTSVRVCSDRACNFTMKGPGSVTNDNLSRTLPASSKPGVRKERTIGRPVNSTRFLSSHS